MHAVPVGVVVRDPEELRAAVRNEFVPVGVREAVREVPEELRAAGFAVRNEFVSVEEEARLLELVDSGPWETQLSRRTQHYGYRFDYRTKSCVPASAAVPQLFLDVLRRLGWSDRLVQCTVNEYQPGQGIAPHVDTHAAFDDRIMALSLGSGVALRVKRSPGDHPVHTLWLEPRSLITYVGAARYAFTHGIVSRKGDLVDGVWRLRGRRVSLTLRHLPSRCAACATCVPHVCECHCGFPDSCDARPGGAPKFLPTRLKAVDIKQ